MTKHCDPPPDWPSPPCEAGRRPLGGSRTPSWGPAPSGWQFWADVPGKAGMPLAAKIVLGVVAGFVGVSVIGLIGAGLSVVCRTTTQRA